MTKSKALITQERPFFTIVLPMDANRIKAHRENQGRINSIIAEKS